MKIYDRAAGKYTEEKEYGKKGLNFLYNTIFGRILLKIFFCRKIYSELNAAYMRSRLSVRKIRPFAEKYGIYLSLFEGKNFNSFDDFFTRKCVFTTDCAPEELIAPCCGRLSAYTINEELSLKIKGSVYSLTELVGSLDASGYRGGICLVYRLAVEDCHRYVFCDDGEIIRTENIRGVLHTVRPVSERFRVFAHNHRVCTLMRTKRFGNVVQIEVGALQVGKIVNHNIKSFSRMDEKGFFRFGGSTIIQLFQKNAVSVDEDIEKLSESGIEVLVKTGERVGRIRC